MIGLIRRTLPGLGGADILAATGHVPDLAESEEGVRLLHKKEKRHGGLSCGAGVALPDAASSSRGP